MRSLIAYYSRSGENLVNGVVQYLGIGNTEVLAYILRRFTGADIFRIQPVTDYSENYFRCIDQARQDLQRNYMPGLNYELSDIEEWAQETNTTSDILSRRNLQ